MYDELRVLAVLVSAAVLGALLIWERRLSGPHPATTAGIVSCAGVALFCTVLLIALVGERCTRHPRQRRKKETWTKKATAPTTGKRY